MERVDNPEPSNQPSRNKFKHWLKRIGVAGFLFFLIKGLIWLAIFMGLGSLIDCS